MTIKPVDGSNPVAAPAPAADLSKKSIIDESIFTDIDQDGDGFISPAEAKDKGFCAWEIKENLSQADFEAKVKEYNASIAGTVKSEPPKPSQTKVADDKADDEKTEFKEGMFQMHGFQFESNEIFNNEFEKIWAKNSGDIAKVGADVLALASKQPHEIILKRISGGDFYNVPLSLIDKDFAFDDIDMTKYPEAMRHITFNENTFAKVSKEHLPEGFNPAEIMEKGKSIGLGIYDVHKAGYTGKGISYAIIDSGVTPHNDLKYKEYHLSSKIPKGEPSEHFHGAAVSYIAQEIAPDADCYFYAVQNGYPGMSEQVVDNLKAIAERNKSLPNDRKIRFLSMSMPLWGGEEAKKAVKELEKQGVWVFYCGDCVDANDNFGYLGKINPNGDPNDFNNYQLERLAGDKPEDALYVNSGDRTVPDAASPSAYRHDSRASQSWSVPVIAGYYTLACQVDPTMNREKFISLAHQTARKIQSTIPCWEQGKADYSERSKERYTIKVIDIKALLEAAKAN